MILVGVRALQPSALARASAGVWLTGDAPDLVAELAYWQERLKLRDWTIEVAYVDDLRSPETGANVWGLCWREPDNRTARIEIRTPRSDAEAAEVYDTIVHELLHCLQAPTGAPTVVEEQIVWTLAPLLTQLRLAEPARASALAKALAKPDILLAAQVRARAGGRSMDPEKIKAIIAALTEGNGEAALKLLEALLVDAVAAPAAAPESARPAGEAKEPEAPTPPPMGAAAVAADPAQDPKYKRLEEQLATDRAAAVDGLLDTRPDLTPKQRTRLRVLGLAEGVAAVRQDLTDLVPLPKAAPAPEREPEARARLGLAKAPRGGTGGALAKASGDPKVDALFRIMPDAGDDDGVEILDRNATGKLVTFSVQGAWGKIAKATSENTERAKARMGIGGAT